jgi:hypothetical protein
MESSGMSLRRDGGCEVETESFERNFRKKTGAVA